MEEFDRNKYLVGKDIIDSIDDNLYRIGLCFTSVRDRPKRRLINNPFIVFTFILIFAINRLILQFFDESNEMLFIKFGDFGCFIGVRREMGIIFINYSIISLIS